jgi:hypothetical protein
MDLFVYNVSRIQSFVKEAKEGGKSNKKFG